MATTNWLDEHMGEVTDVPRGRKGLWGALANSTCRKTPDGWLPVVDAAALGASLPSMFDFDPLASIDLTIA